MLLSRLILIPVLLLAQVCSAACGRSLFVWCLGPHGDLKLELPHDACRHDCEEPVGSEDEQTHPDDDLLIDPHGCTDAVADITVPAMRRAVASNDIRTPVGTPVVLPPAHDGSLFGCAPRIARARAMLDRPPPALRALRTVRLLI